MPWESQRQANLMRVAAKNPSFARQMGVDQTAARTLVQENDQSRLPPPREPQRPEADRIAARYK